MCLIVDGTIHSSNGSADEEGQRYASGIGGYGAVSHHWSEEKSQQPDVHSTWCAYAGGTFSRAQLLTQTIIEVDVSSLGLVTAGGKVVWGKYAQISNNPGMSSGHFL
jgi:ribosomal protein S8E